MLHGHALERSGGADRRGGSCGGVGGSRGADTRGGCGARGARGELRAQQDTLARAENGQNLDTSLKAAEVQLVRDFFAQPNDFKTFTGKHPFEVIESYDEHGDMGSFSGIARASWC
jgi:hypothetical protein